MAAHFQPKDRSPAARGGLIALVKLGLSRLVQPTRVASEPMNVVKLGKSQAKRLLAKGDPRGAAEVLLQVGLTTEAAHLLKYTGFVKEAAWHFVQAKAWEQAEGCFWTLGDPISAAHCAKAAGKLGLAADTFEREGHTNQAAECRAGNGEWQRAARLYLKDGRPVEAGKAYLEWLRQDETAIDKLEGDDLRCLVAAQGKMPFEPILVRIIDQHDGLPLLLQTLLENDRLRLAKEVYESFRPQLGPEFWAWSGTSPARGHAALALAEAVGSRSLAGKVLEEMGRSVEAIDAYDDAGDFESASNLCLKNELWDRLAAVKAKAAAHRQEAVDDEELPIKSMPRAAPSDLDDMPSVIKVDRKIRGNGQPSATSPAPEFNTSGFFRDLVEDDRRALWTLGSVRTSAEGETLVDFDDLPTGTFTLLRGAATIYRRIDGEEIVVDVIEAGHNFGQSWLLHSRPSGVRIVAAAPCEFHLIERDALDDATADDTQDSKRLVKALTENVISHLFNYMPPAETEHRLAAA